MNKLIMTKQVADISILLLTLEILQEKKNKGIEYVSNKEYKSELILKVNKFTEKTDESLLVKQSEQARYFSLAEGNFEKKQLKITKRGEEFLIAYNSSDSKKIFHLLSDVIINTSFGRYNTAVKSSNSDIDPPKLFVKSIIDLDGVTTNEFAILLILTNDLGLDYVDSINEIKNIRLEYSSIRFPTNNLMKYKDNKFTKLLHNLDYCYCTDDKKYKLNKDIPPKVLKHFESMSIYNSVPIKKYNYDAKDISFDKMSTSDKNNVEYKVKTEEIYTNSEKFKKLNDREPKLDPSTRSNNRYLTSKSISVTALDLSNNCCEINRNHVTFTGKSGYNFTEAHHIVPMFAQRDFKSNLDRIENIVSLCPNCHRALHYGDNETRKQYLLKIFEKRKELLKAAKICISFESLYTNYYK